MHPTKQTAATTDGSTKTSLIKTGGGDDQKQTKKTDAVSFTDICKYRQQVSAAHVWR